MLSSRPWLAAVQGGQDSPSRPVVLSSETSHISTPARSKNFFSRVCEPFLVVTPSNHRPSPIPSQSTMTFAFRPRSNASQHQRLTRECSSTPLTARQWMLDLFLAPSTSRPPSPRPRPSIGSAQRSITSFWVPQSDVGLVFFLSILLMTRSLPHAHHFLVRRSLIKALIITTPSSDHHSSTRSEFFRSLARSESIHRDESEPPVKNTIIC